MPNAVIVKLIKLGEEIKQYEISNNPTIGGLLDMAGEEFVENTITVNGNCVSRTTALFDGDKVFIGKATKGNIPFEVQLVRLGSTDGIISLPAEDSMTVRQVMEQLPADKKATFYTADGKEVYEYRLASGQAVESSYTIPRPTSGTVRLILSTRTKGNN